jgi:hypothetical protein
MLVLVPDPNPRIRTSDSRIPILQFSSVADKMLICLLLFDGAFTSVFHKVKKKSLNSRNLVLSYFFCMLMEGSGSDGRPKTGRNIKYWTFFGPV